MPAGSDLAMRLRARLEEIDQATITRVFAISPPELKDPEYVQGLRTAIRAALEYGITGLEGKAERPPPVPVVLLAQARLAARNGVSLETVLRRYFAGYSLLGDFLIEEADAAGVGRGDELKRLMRISSSLFDHVLAAVSEQYRREARERVSSSRQRREEQVERLLAGELVVPTEFSYDLDGHHVGLNAFGAGSVDFLRELAACLDARFLLVPRVDGTVWGWLGGRRRLDPNEVGALAGRKLPEGIAIALGEPDEGLSGWRLTHRQAKAALTIARSGPVPIVRYAEVALIASTLQDDLLTTSLTRLFLEPIEADRDGGATAFQTLRAYFAAERNAASAASALGVSRQAVNGRLKMVEARIGRSVGGCSAELEIALRVMDLEERRRDQGRLLSKARQASSSIANSKHGSGR